MQQVWIYIDEGDSHHGHSVVSQVFAALQAVGCPGATVLRAVGGYGVHGVVHSDLAVEFTGHLPLVITFIDREERVQRVLPTLSELVTEGLIAVTPVQIIKISHREGGPFPRHLTVAAVMTRDVTSVRPDTPTAAIIRLLLDHAVRALPVVADDGTVRGLITDGDLLRRGATSLPLRLRQLLPSAEYLAQVEATTQQPQHAAELMTPNPLTLRATTPLGQAAAVMAAHNLKRMPVIDATDQLVGMVSRYDLLKTVADSMEQHPHAPLHLSSGAPATVGALLITEVPTVYRDTPLAESLDRLLEREQRRVVVLDNDQRVVGIITDGDVLRRAGRRVQPGVLQRLAAWLGGAARPEELEVVVKGQTAVTLMTSPVITVTPTTPTPEAIRLMLAHAIKHLPVVNAAGHLLGMVGRAAVLAALQDGDPPA